MYEGATVTFEVFAADVDGDALGYAWVLDGAAAGDDAPEFTWTAPAGSAGEHRLGVSVSDGRGGVDGFVWTITVEPPGRGGDDDEGDGSDDDGASGVSCAHGGAPGGSLPAAPAFLFATVLWILARYRDGLPAGAHGP
jgi:hypothetical protein